MKRLVTAFLFVVASSVSVLAQSLPVPSYWLNQRLSEMKLYSINQQGIFSGVYINHAADFACQGTPFAVNGQVVGNRVVFTVIWNNGIQNCNSKTVWQGTVAGRRINTQWILYSPNGNQRGTDIFLQQP
ncbi:MAG: avidin/streptavidin family protein [Xanthobacteraceae bacterium]